MGWFLQTISKVRILFVWFVPAFGRSSAVHAEEPDI